MSIIAGLIIATGLGLTAAPAEPPPSAGPAAPPPCPGCFQWLCETRGSVHIPVALRAPDKQQAVLRALFVHVDSTFGGQVPTSVHCTPQGG